MLLLGTGRLTPATEALETTRYRGGRRRARRMGANSVFGFRPRAIRRASGLERDQILRAPSLHVPFLYLPLLRSFRLSLSFVLWGAGVVRQAGEPWRIGEVARE